MVVTATAMRHILLAVVFGFSALIALSFRWARASAPSNSPASPKQPVIVELFTSEGCSSCPPADSLLKKLSDDQPFDDVEIIALEEHVDYWNSLGWIDPFSSSDYSRRQESYAFVFHDGGVYTPQMVIDGRAQFVGSRTHEAHDQIRWAAAHPKSRLVLTQIPAQKPHSISIELRLDPAYPLNSSSPLELWVGVTEKGLHSNVTAGENSGETLQHAPIVRQLRKLHSVSPPLSAPVSFSLNLNDHWNPANVAVIAFLAHPHSHQILAAGSSPLNP
jgi:hypothetical protein